MGTETIDKVIVTANLENQEDLFDAQEGRLTADKVRRVEVTDAKVDMRANLLGVPKRLIAQLGLRPFSTRRVRTPDGSTTLAICTGVRLTMQGRDCHCEVLELSDEYPVLIGKIPLLQLDFVIDPVKKQLIGNPAHGGEEMIEWFGSSYF